MSAKGMKALKVLHLVSAIAWFGSAISMNLLRHLVEVEDAAGMYWMAEILEAIDMKILVPGAIGCLLTGIVYGAFTNWGFFRHRWLTVKWVLTLFMILFGTFYMGPLVKDIESSTREERLDYVLNEWPCLHNCEPTFDDGQK